jgi:hypothetical protein
MQTTRRPNSEPVNEVAEVREQGSGLTAEPPKRDVSREPTNVMVVGPPGCCGCVSKPVGSSSRRAKSV